MAKRDPIETSPQASFVIHPRSLARLWGTGLISTEETLGCLLAYLARQTTPDDQLSNLQTTPNDQLNTQNSKLKTPSLLLGTMVRQLGETFEALTGGDLDLWRVEGLWFWRWEDTGQQAARGLAAYSDALADALEQRYPAEFGPPCEEDVKNTGQ